MKRYFKVYAETLKVLVLLAIVVGLLVCALTTIIYGLGLLMATGHWVIGVLVIFLLFVGMVAWAEYD